MSASRTTIPDEVRLDNVHPAEDLREDFLIGSDIPVAEISARTGIAIAELQALLDGRTPVTAEIDLRLGRYFRMSEGFFMRLQDQYELAKPSAR